jgi:hypothetical protein
MSRYLDLAREALADLEKQKAKSTSYERNEKNEITPQDWNDAPEGEGSSPFGDKEMQAIKDGHLVMVWLGIVQEWVYWVRDDDRRDRLKAQGCEIPIYTLGELAVIQPLPDAAIKQIHEAKKKLGGKVVT